MQELDLSGLKCPLPVLKTQKALANLSKGERLTVTTTDPMAGVDIPHFCSQKGHHLIRTEQPDPDKRSTFKFIIEKAGAA